MKPQYALQIKNAVFSMEIAALTINATQVAAPKNSTSAT